MKEDVLSSEEILHFSVLSYTAPFLKILQKLQILQKYQQLQQPHKVQVTASLPSLGDHIHSLQIHKVLNVMSSCTQ